MFPKGFSTHCRPAAYWALAALPASAAVAPAPVAFSSGDLVRLARKETIQFKGEAFLGAPKGQEFTVLKHEPAKGQVFLAFVQKEGGVIAVTLPDSALELVPPDGWSLLLRGTQAFRDQRFDDSKKLLARAAQDATYKALALSMSGRMEGIMQAAGRVAQVESEVQPQLTALEQKRKASPENDSALKALVDSQLQRVAGPQKLFLDAVGQGRDMASELATRGYTSLAQALEEGIDRLGARVLVKREGAPELPASKTAREDLMAKASQAAFSVVRCRQAMAVRRMMEASSYIEEGLRAEPARPELKQMQTKVKEEIRDAEDRCNAAQENRKRNLAQALLALERGLKICADHPELLKLREDMSGALEEKTAPPVTPALLAAAGGGAAPVAILEQGRQLYTTRCTQCHDLEMLDSRSVSAWKSEVAGMARRAKIDEAQQEVIMKYIAAAHATGGKGRGSE